MITGISAVVFLCLVAVGAGVASRLGTGDWVFSLLGALGMFGWGAHIVGIGLGVEAMRSQDRRWGVAGLLINLISLAFWLGLVPVALD